MSELNAMSLPCHRAAFPRRNLAKRKSQPVSRSGHASWAVGVGGHVFKHERSDDASIALAAATDRIHLAGHCPNLAFNCQVAPSLRVADIPINVTKFPVDARLGTHCLRGDTYLTLSVYCTYVMARTTSNRTSFRSKRLDQPFLSILFGRKRNTRVEPDSSSSSSAASLSRCRGSATCAFWRPRFSLPVLTTFGKTAVVVYRLIPQRDDKLVRCWAAFVSRRHVS